MKLNKMYLLCGILFLVILYCCLGSCMREGLDTHQERKDHNENRKESISKFQQNNKELMNSNGTSVLPFDADENNAEIIGPGGEQQHNLGPGGEQQNNLGPGGEQQHNLGPGGEQQHNLGPGGEQQHNLGPGGEQQRKSSGAESEGEYINQLHKSISPFDNNNNQQGIPKSQIPKGNEDLYILKSEVVPPVCPVCPPVLACESKDSKCQPCPPCARCPEPAFDCKKVPNYNTNDDNYLPRPVLSDFSQFGM